jgi:hypothetical protein
MRFSVEGWVENRLSIWTPARGLTMKSGAIAGFCCAGGFSIWRAALSGPSMSSRPVVAATAACSGLRPVGLRVVHQIDTRHRQPGASAELAHEADEFGRSAIIDLLRSVHRKHELCRTSSN